jgi:hypothetical protein
MAIWICHPHPVARSWVIAKSRNGYPGLFQSFEAACQHASDDKNWGGKSGQYAFADYLPNQHPFTFPMIVKLRIEAAYVTVVGLVLEHENMAFTAE